MSDLSNGLTPDLATEPEVMLEPLRCVYPECDGLTFSTRLARNEHGYATHLQAALAAIQQPNPDLFKPSPQLEPVAELPLDWADREVPHG
ncbi:hypothetical protein OHA70_25490 [Kribbella sp. NBC_00382]|uniref:hypothetical protein n=1 Tax=Kribbella sp. NBC_00382 TaxID=2975967 RepID=UPI002E1BFA94